MSTQTGWNQSYYGQPFAARQLVMQMQGTNPGADPLRDLLTRYGGRNAAYMPPPPQPLGYAPAYPPYQPQGMQTAPQQQPNGYLAPPPPSGRGPVQEQNLAPPQ